MDDWSFPGGCDGQSLCASPGVPSCSPGTAGKSLDGSAPLLSVGPRVGEQGCGLEGVSGGWVTPLGGHDRL